MRCNNMLNFFREMSNFFESNLRFSGKFTIFQVEMVLFSVNIADFWLNSLFSGHMLTSFAKLFHYNGNILVM